MTMDRTQLFLAVYAAAFVADAERQLSTGNQVTSETFDWVHTNAKNMAAQAVDAMDRAEAAEAGGVGG